MYPVLDGLKLDLMAWNYLKLKAELVNIVQAPFLTQEQFAPRIALFAMSSQNGTDHQNDDKLL